MSKIINIIAAICCMISLVQCVIAEPNTAALESYRCLVPDWSKTSGGKSPAISPDGKTLAYLVGFPESSEVWIIPNLEYYQPSANDPRFDPSIPEAWQLDINFPGLKRIQITDHGHNYRNADWSPDSKRVAFIFKGRLLLAEDFDYCAKTAETKMLADVKSNVELGLTNYWVAEKNGSKGLDEVKSELAAPRWSPDGTKIAFLRTFTGSFHSVCIYDINTNKETILAQDANYGPEIWEQPWSPDNKYLAYNSVSKIQGGSFMEMGGVSIVSIATGTSKKVINENNCSAPSWSPKGDKLAFSLTKVQGPPKNSSSAPLIFVSDINGKNRKQLTQDLSYDIETTLRNTLHNEYGTLFSADQINSLIRKRKQSLSLHLMFSFAEARMLARSIRGEFKKDIDLLTKSFSSTGEINENKLHKAIFKLAKSEQMKLSKRVTKVVVKHNYSVFDQLAMDIMPVWSPDGKSLAFIHCKLMFGEQQLRVVDVATHETQTLFTSFCISATSWTKDGKSIITQSSRNLTYASPYASKLDLVTTPSYPEIWMLDLKQK